MLTTLGLAIALLGIVVLYVAVGPDGGPRARWTGARSPPSAHGLPDEATLVAFVLILVGLATKIGWAPVHNWLPDAHSEAPPPVSAMLSAALLPTVLLIAWRSKLALEPALGAGTVRRAVHRLRAALARRRGPVPLAAAALEAPAGLLQPRAHGRPRPRDRLRHAAGDRRRRRPRRRPRAREVARVLRGDPAAARTTRAPPKARRAGVGRTSAAAARRCRRQPRRRSPALPPSPLFVSELMILLGGFDAGRPRSPQSPPLAARARLPRARPRPDRGRRSARRAARSRRPTRSAQAIGAARRGRRALALLALTVGAPTPCPAPTSSTR